MKRRKFLTLTAASLVGVTACKLGGRARMKDVMIWGGQGLRDGAFIRPRAVCASAGEVFVIDTTGRVQVFSEDGKFLRLWSTPQSENGTPTGCAVNPAGNLVIPDTHYSRVLEYSRAGELLASWGGYGSGPEQFIYPTGVALGPDGAYYFSEYGEDAERVHVFDAGRRFVRQWGAFGTEPGQFNRAMGIARDDAGAIHVVDTANHRVQRFDPAGKLLGVIGGPGTEPGRLKFPQAIAFAPDRSFLVCEYGANRLSRFDAAGAFIAAYGLAGREPGEFNSPRGAAVSASGYVFCADTDNHRVQRFTLERA